MLLAEKIQEKVPLFRYNELWEAMAAKQAKCYHARTTHGATVTDTQKVAALRLQSIMFMILLASQR